MSVVTLTSGGLDSTLMAAMIKAEGLRQYPLFINYGQRNVKAELLACRRSLRRLGVFGPQQLDARGYGQTIKTGLTSRSKDIYLDAFTPCRNLMFVVFAGAYAHQVGALTIAIGLLSDAASIFPDQTSDFLKEAAHVISNSLGVGMRIVAPLMGFTKKDIVRMASDYGIRQTYSCHRGGTRPCGACIACLEYNPKEVA